MTSKLTITRERLEKIKSWRETYGAGSNVMLPAEEAEELARMALAAMDGESITVTDDMAYAFHHALTDSMIGADDVEGIKTGLGAVFANLTAPVVSAEYPDRLPCSVLLEPGLRFGKGIKTSTMLAALARRAVYESDMAALPQEERTEFQARIEDLKALIAQPAPVVNENLYKLANHIASSKNGLPDEWQDWADELEADIRRAAMLQARSDDDGEPTDDERIMAIEGINNCERCGDEGWIVGEMGITRCACNQGNPVFKIDLNSDFIKHVKAVSEKVRAGNSPLIPGAEQRIADAVELLKQAAPAMLADNHVPDGPLVGRLKSPVIPEGYVMVPMRLTAENGAKGALSGEFSETKFINCPECFGDDECETCDGSGRIEITVPVTWTTIKEIWAKGVEHFAAAPQEDINALIPLVSRNEQEVK